MQWVQLSVLTLTHATADLFTSILLPLVPLFRERYGFSLAGMVAVITAGNIAANAVQLLASNFRASWRHPGLVIAGVLGAGTAACAALVPVGPLSLAALAALMVLAGSGVAIVHPEGLRAVHGLNRIPPAVATAVFMVGGFLGYAGGARVAAQVVQQHGLGSLPWLLLAPVLCVALVAAARVRLVPEEEPLDGAAQPPAAVVPRLPFSHLFVMACLVTSAASILGTLLPTRLYEAGFPLLAGGNAVFVFGLGGAVGSLTWSAWAPRIGYVRTLAVSLGCGLPLLVVYFLLATSSTQSSIFLAAGAFCVYASYPLLVTLARHAESRLRFSQRMALIVGGAWGTASVVLWLAGLAADRVGVGPVLHLVWIFYALAALYALWMLTRARQRTQAS
jgi:FSR family fosmidomycin resistance protein-like MFS transporter